MLVSRKTLQSEFSLAYAMTVHKSQGSEFKAVVIGFEKSWARLLQRNLLYTAVTRAKKECRIIGEMKTVDEAILQMNMLGHEFYMFINEATGLVSVVYCRIDGCYGLLEPSAE